MLFRCLVRSCSPGLSPKVCSEERPGPSSRSSEGRTQSPAPILCVASGWQHLPGKAPVIGPGCPVALPDSPCGEVVWRPLASVCIHVGKALGTGQPGCCWAPAGCVLRVCPVLGLPLRLITPMMLLSKACPGGTAASLEPLLSRDPQARLSAGLPPPLHTGRDSGSEISSLAQDRVRTQTQTCPQGSTATRLWPQPRPAAQDGAELVTESRWPAAVMCSPPTESCGSWDALVTTAL